MGDPPRMHLANRLEDLSRSGPLDQITIGPGGKRLEHLFVFLENRQHDCADLGGLAP